MKSKAFITGMLEQTHKMLKDCSWWQFCRKARIRGYIAACEVLTED